MSQNPDAPLVNSLRERIDSALAEALGDATEVALVNFYSPASSWPRRRENPGDMAIWLGIRDCLRRLGVAVVYQCAWDTLSVPALRRRLPQGPVLLSGGGDFGDLYPFGAALQREQLLAELRNVPMIQLPVAAYFQDPANTDRLRRLATEHNNFILMIRDKISEERAREVLDLDIRLVPDLVFALQEPLTRASPAVDIVWHCWLPTDAEYVDYGAPPDGFTSRIIQWTRQAEVEPRSEPRDAIVRGLHLALGRRMARWPAWRGLLWRPYSTTFEPLARASLRRAIALEGAGRVLVTNKLHGHILAVLAGIPHVVLDNSFGKVRGVHETWTRSSRLAHWAVDGHAARQIVHDMLASNEDLTPAP